MRFLRALIIGLLSIFPGTIIGYLGWLLVGASEDNYSLEVMESDANHVQSVRMRKL